MTRNEFTNIRTAEYVINGITVENIAIALLDAAAGDRTTLDRMIELRKKIKESIPKPEEWDEDYTNTPDPFIPLS